MEKNHEEDFKAAIPSRPTSLSLRMNRLSPALKLNFPTRFGSFTVPKEQGGISEPQNGKRELKKQESEEFVGTPKSNSDFKKEYETVKKIGNGAHASVLVVKQIKTGKTFCAKVIPYEELEDLFTAIYEYKMVRSLSHPNIIQFHEIFINIPGKEIVIICEYDEELKPLKYFIKKKIIISEDKLCQVMAQFFNALNYMHTQGICHRDISIDNLLASDSSLRSVKIIDFGTAYKFKTVKKTLLDDLACKRSLEVKKMSARVGGKESYMAPEMLNGSFYDQEVDTYSMCQVLLDCCSLIGKSSGSAGKTRPAKKSVFKTIKAPPQPESNEVSPDFPLDEEQIYKPNDLEPQKLEGQAKNPGDPLSSNLETPKTISLNFMSYSEKVIPNGKDSPTNKNRLASLEISPELRNLLERGLDSKRELRLTVKEAMYHPWLSSKSKNRRPKTKMYTQEVSRPGESQNIQDHNWVFEEVSISLDQLTKLMTEHCKKIPQDLIEKGRKNGIFIQV